MAEQTYQSKPEANDPHGNGPEEQATAEGQAPEKSLEERLAEANARADQQREALLRAVAEAENTRKRVQAEAANSQKYALERFAETLLPGIDSLEAALNADKATAEALRSGVEITLKQLKSALERQKIAEINPAPGDRFDPHRHQAMSTVPSEAEPNSIVSVMQKGYSLHDRLLRPALVTVAKPLEKHPTNPNSDTDLD
jgi:molecular chaperone GrpE